MQFKIFFEDHLIKFLVVCILPLLILLYQLISSKHSKNFIKCYSEDCVRCSSKLKIKQIAKDNFKRFIKKNSLYNLDRIKRALYKDDLINLLKKFANSLVTPYNALMKQKPNLLYIEELTSNPIWSSEKFKYVEQILMLHVNNIREEFKNIFQTIYFPETRWKSNSVESGHWYLYYLYNQGSFYEENNCPITVSVINKLDKYLCKSLFFNVAFSVLEENSIVTPHFGPTNARIRCHLGLSIPNNECIINCGNKSERLLTGKCLFFDDSFYHGSKFLLTKNENNIIQKDLPFEDYNNLQNNLINQNKETNLSHKIVNKKIDNKNINTKFRRNPKDHGNSIKNTIKASNLLNPKSLFNDNNWKNFNDGSCIDLKYFRCVLIIDIWHPDLTLIEQEAITYCYPPI